MKNRWIACLLSLTLLTGCQQTKNEDNTLSSYTFDNYGQEVSIDQVPEKVLTLGPNCTELLVSLGLQDSIIGTSLSNHSRGPLEEYKDIYEELPMLTYGSATREAVLSSGADFVYGIDWEFGSEGLDIDELRDFGITTYMNSAITLEEMYQEIEDIGTIFDVKEQANALIVDQQERIKSVESKVASKEPLKVLVYDSGGTGVFTCSGTNFESLLIEKAGGQNIFDDLDEKQWITVSTEEVLQRNPDVIIIHDYDSPSLEEKIEEIKSDPALSQLDCVKNERFIPITLESVLPGDRMALTIETIAQGLYPELF